MYRCALKAPFETFLGRRSRFKPNKLSGPAHGRGRSLATDLDPSGHDVAVNWSRHDQQAGGKELHRLSGADEADQMRPDASGEPASWETGSGVA